MARNHCYRGEGMTTVHRRWMRSGEASVGPWVVFLNSIRILLQCFVLALNGSKSYTRRMPSSFL